MNGSITDIEKFLNQKADIESQAGRLTALAVAVKAARLDVVKLLVKKGANTKALMKPDKSTILMVLLECLNDKNPGKAPSLSKK